MADAAQQVTMAEDSVLKVSSLCKSYGAKTVLDDVSFSLKSGEIFGLIGLNGVGKTTMIKIILDLSSGDEGEATIFGAPSRTLEARRKLSYLPEKFTPSRYLFGREYLSLALSYYDRPFGIERAKEMAQKLDLDPQALDMKVGAYSKGMAQKLGLVGALLVEQPLLILDEPMSGLDPRARIDLKQQLLAAKDAGKTVFFSSHILSDIEEICDRIAILDKASIQFVGTPSEFKQAHEEPTLERCFLKAINA